MPAFPEQVAPQPLTRLEDLGWFVIDNLPPTLISKVAELIQTPGATTSRVVLVTGTGAFFDELAPAIEELRSGEARVRVLFLDANDEILVRRFEGTRRRHPMQEGGIAEAIASERELLTQVKANADVVVDTGELNVHQLRDPVVELFGFDENAGAMRTAVMSFGYKYGLPLDVDLVFDCRFLPNPHWEPELRPQTGTRRCSHGITYWHSPKLDHF